MQEVKDTASPVINNCSSVLMAIPGPGGTYKNGAVFSDVITLLSDKACSFRLHWRESVVADVLFASMAPVVTDQELLQAMVAAEVHDALDGRTSLAKVRRQRACAALCPVLHRAALIACARCRACKWAFCLALQAQENSSEQCSEQHAERTPAHKVRVPHSDRHFVCRKLG